MTNEHYGEKVHYDGKVWEVTDYWQEDGEWWTRLVTSWVTNDRHRDIHTEVRETRSEKLMECTWYR